MSGLLSRCPPLRAQAHTVRKPGCLRARLVCACPACPPLWGFACFASCRSPFAATGSRAHTATPTRFGVGALVFALGVAAWACCGRVCSRVVWCLRLGCVRLGCLRFLGVGALAWGGGTIVSRRPFTLACLRAYAFGVGLLACAGYCAAGATVMGRDNHVPPHTAWRCPRCVACKRRVGVLSWCANTRARAERKGGGGGEPRGAGRGGLGGGCGWWRVGW